MNFLFTSYLEVYSVSIIFIFSPDKGTMKSLLKLFTCKTKEEYGIPGFARKSYDIPRTVK
jgi:hypothetical protein